MLIGVSVGAPPDVLGPRGQNWGLGAFSPRALRQHGYQAYIEMLRAAFRYAGGVRIDHILGLARLWLVPEHAPGAHGAYLRYPFDDLIRLIALESHRYKAIVIGEDLGTIPPGFDEALADAGLMGIRVLWFAREGDRFRPADQWSRNAIATTTTHDLPTAVGWWQGRDIAWRAELDLQAPGTLVQDEYAARDDDRRALCNTLNAAHRDNRIDSNDATAPLAGIFEFVGSTAAPLVIVPLEDALALTEQPNLPNTIDTHPNWRRRLPASVKDMLDDEAVAARLAALNRARSQVRAPKE
jgi:4-alpha-glucanotransferase